MHKALPGRYGGWPMLDRPYRFLLTVACIFRYALELGLNSFHGLLGRLPTGDGGGDLLHEGVADAGELGDERPVLERYVLPGLRKLLRVVAEPLLLRSLRVLVGLQDGEVRDVEPAQL